MSVRSGGSAPLRAVAAMALAASGPLWAAEGDDEAARLSKPETQLGGGITVVSDDNTRFGQYTGMVKKGAYGIFDIDSRTRDDQTGSWFNITGRNLGIENQSLRVDHLRQGDWGYFLEYGQTPRYSPYTVNTRLVGVDGTTQTVNGAAVPYELDLKTLRQAFAAGFDKALGSNFSVALRFRNEDKEGRRLYGRTGTDFLVDPIKYSTQIWEAIGSYSGKSLQLNAAYLGTNFANQNPKIDVFGGTGTGYSPIATPPGNQSHQLSLDGGYNFTSSTRLSFKAAYTQQTQTSAFIDTSTTGRSDLGGRVDTTFGQVGLSTRPTKDLSIVASLRYDNRDDKTPVYDYFNITTTSTATGENEPRSIRTLFGKVEAIYRLPQGFSAVGGVDYDDKKRNTSAVRVVSFRDKTEEISYRGELRRAMSETVNGSVAYVHSARTGSPWLTTVDTTGAAGSNTLRPLHLADRDRDLLRARINWMATERIDLQFLAEGGRDKYSTNERPFGMLDGTSNHFAVDGALRLNQGWQLTAWISQDDLRTKQQSCQGASGVGVCPATAANPIWDADMRNVGNALGAGLRGKPGGPYEVGADLQMSEDRGKFKQEPLATGAGLTALPDSVVTRTTFKLYTKYAIDKTKSLRLQYGYDRFRSDDWTWTTWTYSDGTKVLPNPNQEVQYIGVMFQLGL